MKSLISFLLLFGPALAFAETARFQCQGHSPTEGYFEIHQFTSSGRLTRMLVKTQSGVVVSMDTMGPNNFPGATGDVIFGIARRGRNVKLMANTLPDSRGGFNASVDWPLLGADFIKVGCAMLN